MIRQKARRQTHTFREAKTKVPEEPSRKRPLTEENTELVVTTFRQDQH